jgi:geranylgeranylglycerol-phosphate geranylgeranyltransferase
VLLSAAGVLVGAWWAAGGLPGDAWLAACAAAALTVAANARNDLADVAIDRMAHPDRPLPSGRLPVERAQRAAEAGEVVGIALSLLARPVLGILSVLVVAVLRAYNSHLKRRGLPGNVAVAVLASLPFLYGAWAVGRPLPGLLLVAVGAPLHFAREIAKDLEDAPGDAAARATLPLTRGTRVARAALAAGALLFAIAVTPLAVRSPPFAFALGPAIFLTAVAARRAIAGARGSPAIFKAAMLCAMLALAVVRP